MCQGHVSKIIQKILEENVGVYVTVQKNICSSNTMYFKENIEFDDNKMSDKKKFYMALQYYNVVYLVNIMTKIIVFGVYKEWIKL